MSENINRHHYSHQANETKNYGSSVMAGGSATLAALGGDLTLAGSGVTAGMDALLQAKGNVALKEVTDHSYNYLRTVSHGFLSKKTITQSKDTTIENGSLIAANDNIAVMSGGQWKGLCCREVLRVLRPEGYAFRSILPLDMLKIFLCH